MQSIIYYSSREVPPNQAQKLINFKRSSGFIQYSPVKLLHKEYIKSLKARGLDSTAIAESAKEANFIDYGNALGSNVQNMVIDSFGKEGTAEGKADSALQS